MKKIISLLLVAVLVLGLCACSASDDKAAVKGLQVGFNRQSITPTESGVPIAGGDSSARLSTGFLDEVATTCIAFSMNGETYLVYTLDFMIVYNSIIDPVKQVINKATGVPTTNIIFNCTHTHSGVDINSSKWDGVGAYRELFSTRCLKAAEKAIEDLSPATVSYGSTQAENMSFVRHYRMNDGTTYGNGHGSSSSGIKEHMYEADVELQVIKFTREAEDKKDIMIASFPSHATTTNGTDSKSISACYPGAFRNAVEQTAGIHCAFFQGASGDQIPTSKIKGLPATNNNRNDQGKKLAEYALSIELTPMEDAKVVLKSWEYTGKSMKEGTEDPDRVAKASEIGTLVGQKGSSDPAVGELCAKYGFYNVYEATGLRSRSSAPETRTMTLLALQLGSEVAIAFAPYEMFGMHGKYIKDNSPFAMDFIVTCSEDYQGYFPHVEGCEEGFYEYHVTKYERGTGEKLAELFASTLAEMKSAG
ncbi:MAG: hypothetical protein IKU07_03980 [Oscillospiraceae bacterium]|nr:hypothetical protein [Oscillospiraceae bacterium]